MTLYALIESELATAREKFPAFHSAHEGAAVIREEFDELWELVRRRDRSPDTRNCMKRECIQIAAMALRFIEDVCDNPDSL